VRARDVAEAEQPDQRSLDQQRAGPRRRRRRGLLPSSSAAAGAKLSRASRIWRISSARAGTPGPRAHPALRGLEVPLQVPVQESQTAAKPRRSLAVSTTSSSRSTGRARRSKVSWSSAATRTPPSSSTYGEDQDQEPCDQQRRRHGPEQGGAEPWPLRRLSLSMAAVCSSARALGRRAHLGCFLQDVLAGGAAREAGGLHREVLAVVGGEQAAHELAELGGVNWYPCSCSSIPSPCSRRRRSAPRDRARGRAS